MAEADLPAVVMLLTVRLKFEGWLSEEERQDYLRRLSVGEDASDILRALRQLETARLNCQGGDA